MASSCNSPCSSLGIVTLVLAGATKVLAQAHYLIVGGGPAGYVVAEQLSQNPQINVTLLEAGPDCQSDDNVNTPGNLMRVGDLMFQYYSQPDENLGGLTPNLWQGRTLGGGAAVNAMGYCRGSASVFDEWAAISGNPGLAWSSIMDDYRATTHYTQQPANYDGPLDSMSAFGTGPVELSRQSGLAGMELPFAHAWQNQANLSMMDAMNGEGIGVYLGLQSIRVNNRTRSYPPSTYGMLMAERTNVQVLANHWVQRIRFSTTRATSVQFVDTLTGMESSIDADEIILAAGALNTPKLLMQSGVGPASTLEDLDIPVVADIQDIGAQLWDHHYSYIEWQMTDDVMTNWKWQSNASLMSEVQRQYQANYSGPLGWNNAAPSYAALRIPDSAFAGVNSSFFQQLDPDRPHVLFQAGAYAFNASLAPNPNVSMVSTWASVTQPEAAGYLTINSSDYREAPLIYSNYYGSPADKAAILYAYKMMRSVLTAEREFADKVVMEAYPGSNSTSDEQLWQAIQRTASSFHHPVGTVPLGKVVDANWRIKGLDGIRVVDSAAIPTLPTCHPMSHVYAVAHRAATDIKQADGI
ncbi:choline dehydrogenase [Diaporthe sp. PMI_573]|nr:choline dehydrogenase [Diaporthaceae sp. PMI_573]